MGQVEDICVKGVWIQWWTEKNYHTESVAQLVNDMVDLRGCG